MSLTTAIVATNISRTACDFPVRDRSHLLIALGAVFIGIGTIVVIQRLGYKCWAKIPLGPDDWFVLAALVLQISSYAMGRFVSQRNGSGRDIWTLRPHNIYTLFRCYYAQTIIYILTFLFVKLSLVFFYLQIFSTHSVRRVRWVLWATVLFNIFVMIAFVIVSIFQCKPISFYWNRWDGKHKGTCVSISALAWSYTAIQIALSFWLLAIPIWLVRSLKLTRRKKLGVFFMFIVGTL